MIRFSIVRYSLTKDGAVPPQISKGGYVRHPSDLPQPQDFWLFGYTQHPELFHTYDSEKELHEYLRTVFDEPQAFDLARRLWYRFI